MQEKVCKECKISKPLDEYFKDSYGKFGVKSKCKECIKKYREVYNVESKHVSQQYYKDNKEKINSQAKEYYQENREEHIQRTKDYQELHPDKIKGYKDKFNELHKNELKEYYKEYRNDRYNNDPSFKIRIVLSNRLKDILKQLKLNKNNSIIKYLGCNLNEFKEYLELKFLPEMSWENHGKIWEIDHIIPCSSFDLTKEENIYKCFHYTNTQPLFKTTKIAESFGYKDQIGNRNKSGKNS